MKDKLFYAFLLLLTVVSCGRRMMTREQAFDRISKKSVYNSYFYAPIHIGKQVVTLDENVKLEKYVDDRYGDLVKAGLINVDIQKESSWRNVLSLSLTENGLKLSDSRRGDDDHAFVAVCRVVPVSVDTLFMADDKTYECHYTVRQQEITPFGRFLGYEDGKTYPVIENLSK